MTALLKKEMRLTASVLSYLFLAFTLMAFIPNYPILIGAFFVCFGVFQTFQKARESNDILFSTLLPVKKTDIVKTKFLFVLIIEGAGLVLTVAFSLVRLLALNKVMPYAVSGMMNTNLAFFGYYLTVYAFFNIFFVGGFFKTAYKIGIPFLKFCIAAFLTVVVGEVLHFIPPLGVLNADFNVFQLIPFFVGVAVFVAGTVAAYLISRKNFNEIDL